MDQNRLEKQLEADEGFREKPYICTAGKLTVGIGWNIEDTPMRYSEAKFRLKNDIRECVFDLQRVFGNQFESMPDHMQEALINMRFQLGPGSFRQFKKFIAAIKRWDLVEAEKQGLDSKWAKRDTPPRAKRVMRILRHGYDTD